MMRPDTSFVFALLCLLTGFLPGQATGQFSESSLHAEEAAALPEKVRFNEHIRPIFTTHCTACHGGVKQAGELSFAYRDKVLPPDGWVVEPGDPDASILLDRVSAKDAELVMPPPNMGLRCPTIRSPCSAAGLSRERNGRTTGRTNRLSRRLNPR